MPAGLAAAAGAAVGRAPPPPPPPMPALAPKLESRLGAAVAVEAALPAMVRVTTHCPGVRPLNIWIFVESDCPTVTLTLEGEVAEGMVTDNPARPVPPALPANEPVNDRVLEALPPAKPPVVEP